MRLGLNGPNCAALKRGACKRCPTAHYAADEESEQQDEFIREGVMPPEDGRLYCPWRRTTCIAQDRRLGFAPLPETEPLDEAWKHEEGLFDAE